jgi:hypothetical protein
MPYKDPERRREYHRQYKRRQREGLSNPGKTLIKCYLCLDFPDVVLGGGLAFKNGFYLTNNPEYQAIIERHEYYGRHIWSWWVEP